jgi:hypothetical protein
LLLLSLDEMASFIIYALQSISSLVGSEPDVTKEAATEAFKLLLAAVVSPIVNTIDFVGRVITTIQGSQAEETECAEESTQIGYGQSA